MARIGIFIDTLQGSIPSSFREKIAVYVQVLSNIAFCTEEIDFATAEGLDQMVRHLQSGGADRIVIIGGSPKIYEAAFHKLKHQLPINPYLFAVANVREQALWTIKDEELAMEKAWALIDKAVRMVNCSQSIETQSLPLKPEVLVLGGGIVGITIALGLARAGIHVTLLEKGSKLGGMALELRRFYDRSEEVQKWIEEKISDVNQTPRLTLFTQMELERVEGHLGRFQATIRNPGGPETVLNASAIVVALGCETRAEIRDIYQDRKVLDLSQMEKLLSETTAPNLSWEGKKIETITFLLDGVNEDIKIDSINAIKQARLLQETFHCRVAILCKEVKVAADGMERLYRKTRERGALFFKYDEPPRISLLNGQIRVEVIDTAAIRKKEQWPVSILSDLLVVSKAFVPATENARIAEGLRLHLGHRGFLMEDNPQFLRVRSNRRGIFVAGACRFPQEISESLIEAKAVIQEVMALFSRENYSYDLSVAEVDPNKCAVCYTCPRLCPHAAITVEKYAEKNVYKISRPGEETKWGAAKVDPVACFGCGICVAECPAKAITLRHLTDDQIYAQMGLSV